MNDDSPQFTSFTAMLKELEDCSQCPRNCHVNRLTGKTGYCKSYTSFNIASVCIHHGEEPVISGRHGICNIFFTNCNLQCIYCQNHQISDNQISRTGSQMELSQLINKITSILDTGITHVGFVSPSHFIPHVKIIISKVEALGYKPVWVFNSNGYDKPETLRTLEGMIDVYLPDLKYMEPALAYKFSDARDYPDVATKALKEMYRQKGSALHLDDDGNAKSGIIVRHLVLPGNVENSLKVLQFIAGETSPRIHVSLMSQYYPTKKVKNHPLLKRSVTREEYRQVVDEMEVLGIDNGWIQEFESSDFYQPDFENEHPFE
ncbi:MAG: 4Fe-4S cluster-binding domain-containing protein [Bacteroidetes bacterium]|nr:4Fe-4S cluster-binding domain-containing protein [Bacteroidota bacterium]